MSVLNLPEPPAWSAGRRRTYFTLLMAMVVFSPIAVYGSWAFMRGHVLTGVVAYGILACPLIMLVFFLVVLAGRTSLRASASSVGTTLRPDRRLGRSLSVGMACFIAADILYLVFVPAGWIVVPLSPGWRIGTLGAMAFALVLVARLAITWWQGRSAGSGGVRLTPNGVEVVTVAATQATPWSEIVDVSDETESKKTRAAVVLHRADGSDQVVDGLDFYVPTGIGLYWMVRHYWRHPDDRDELTDDRAIERLRDGRFDVS